MVWHLTKTVRGGIILIVGITLVLMLAPVVGCTSEAATTASFSYAEKSDPTSLDPALADEGVGVNIVRSLFEGLVKYDLETGEVQPAVAESWEINGDATEFTFHLKRGVKFTNSRLLKSGDFVYAWTRALDPETKSTTALTILGNIQGAASFAQGDADGVAGLEAPDEYTFKVTLASPMAEFVTFLGHPVCSPLPQEEVERGEVDFGENPVGNGPFKLREWRHDELVALERNPDYFGPKPPLGEVVMKVIPNPATAIAELRAGNIDAVKAVPSALVSSLRQDSSIRLFQSDADAVRLLGFNLDAEPWQGNLKLRQALAYAIDREIIAGKTLQGQKAPADGLVPTFVAGHQENAMPYKYEPEQARQLLAEAGYPAGKGLPALTLFYPGEGEAAEVAQTIQASLKQAGIEVLLEGLEPGAFYEDMAGGQLSLYIVTWLADAPSIDSFLYPLFYSGNIDATNVFKYQNSEVDQRLDEARRTPDAAARIKLYNEAERRILADAPVLPLTFGEGMAAYTDRVTSFSYSQLGDLALEQISVTN